MNHEGADQTVHLADQTVHLADQTVQMHRRICIFFVQCSPKHKVGFPMTKLRYAMNLLRPQSLKLDIDWLAGRSDGVSF